MSSVDQPAKLEYLEDFVQGTVKAIRHNYIHRGDCPIGIKKTDLAYAVDQMGDLDNVDWVEVTEMFVDFALQTDSLQGMEGTIHHIYEVLAIDRENFSGSKRQKRSWLTKKGIPKVADELASQYIRIIAARRK